MENKIIIGMIVIGIALIIVCIVRHRVDLIVNFVLRAVLGTAGIYVLELVLKSMGYAINLGINSVTVLVNGILGLPGFLLLYALAIYFIFH
jgi:hypothetical protein